MVKIIPQKVKKNKKANIYSTKVLKYIEYVCKSKINYHPVEVIIDSSLQFDFSNKD